MALRIGSIKTVHIRKKDIDISVDDSGYQGGKIVVSPILNSSIATTSFSLTTGMTPPFKQFLEGIAGIGIMMAVSVSARVRRTWATSLAILGKKPLVNMHQNTLSHGGAGLFTWHVLGLPPFGRPTPTAPAPLETRIISWPLFCRSAIIASFSIFS